ncbi:MAG: hypothetical protein OdinLCB4_000065 [Candidatus Odinarchaeum yellowstonii]|uniref:Restriction endonuclease type IV Mrr domain-containing protein n=1 Tax=Odinarchaeota yellowstonii (strain LCB_4) TaxID=1841599 RepID=A0AAF0D297_ODILC|nr:MAG: hypothetical protein OdinLCB4_000065 [Candidatus Odinarchaeum yellowstonii]
MGEPGLPSQVWRFIARRLREQDTSSKIFLSERFVDENIIRFINQALEREGELEEFIDLKDKDSLSKIIITLIKENLPIEDLSEVLNWVQFEYLCAKIFELNEFDCRIHYCFKESGKRFEIDILAYRNGVILAVDVKHWSARQGKRSQLLKYAEKQDLRARALIQSDKFREDYTKLYVKQVTPLIITLYDESMQFHNGVPVIPVYKLNNFLNSFDEYDLKTYYL